MRQQHRAGEKLFADFAGPTVPILARDGGVEFEAHVFVAVLGASNYKRASTSPMKLSYQWHEFLLGDTVNLNLCVPWRARNKRSTRSCAGR
jgi:ABC-type iron transport system FetAB ATPase subunit